MHSVSRNKKGGVWEGRGAGTDTCTVSAGNSAGEHLPVEVADLYRFVSVCHSVGSVLLVERLCGTSWVGVFQSLFQSKLMKRLCRCCPVFSAASLDGESPWSSSPALGVCAHASQRRKRRSEPAAPCPPPAVPLAREQPSGVSPVLRPGDSGAFPVFRSSSGAFLKRQRNPVLRSRVRSGARLFAEKVNRL